MASQNLPDLSGAVAAAAPGILRVDARRRHPASGLVWSDDGVIVTANHVVRRDEDLSVGLGADDAVPATLVGRDPTTDLAVLRAADGLPTGAAAAPWDEGAELAVGQLALAVGRPGASAEASLALVSALGGAWRTAAGGSVDRWLRLDAVMYPGFSGGALVTAAGRVAGLVTSGLARGAALALPTPTLRRVVADILAHGSVRRARLGVGVQPVRLEPALAARLGRETGVLVVSLDDEGPAAAAGLHVGDTLVALDGHPLRDLDDLMDALTGDRVGRALPITVVRAGAVEDHPITPSAA